MNIQAVANSAAAAFCIRSNGYAAVAGAAFDAISQAAVKAASSSTYRRRLADAAPLLDLSSSATVLSLLQSAQNLAASSLGTDVVNSSAASGVLAAVADAVSAMAQAAANATDLADTQARSKGGTGKRGKEAGEHLLCIQPPLPPPQRAVVVAATTLATSIEALVGGSISAADFAAATSPTALQSAIQSVQLPGADLLAVPTGGSSRALVLGLALGLGCGVPLVAGASLAAWWYRRRVHRLRVYDTVA